MKKYFVAAALATIPLVVGSGAAHGLGYNEPDPETTIDDGAPEPGGTFTVTVTGCDPLATVQFTYLDSQVTETASGLGEASTSFTAPTTPGVTYGVTTCGGIVMSYAVTVAQLQPVPTTEPPVEPEPTPEPTPTTAPDPIAQPLPATGGGSGSSATFAAAVLLVFVGVGLFGVGQRRRSNLS